MDIYLNNVLLLKIKFFTVTVNVLYIAAAKTLH